ncbi:2OG-Fe dioxygenase family protein [Streptomyces sp. NPDC051567]|uniref:2OG-Fe dioxygenase family protein n=1 Tax=Streptomyces sp. NPDC051567 TaxID=3365660 RepID=UPI003798579C
MHVLPDHTLSTEVDVTDDIVRRGFSLVDGPQLHVPDQLVDSLGEFVASYEDLPADPFLPDGGRYRYRRHSRYLFDAATRHLEVIENPGYFQTAENNPFAGGVMRTYEELAGHIVRSPFLAALIAFNCDRLPPQETTTRWEVQAHCVRIVARQNALGRPTPEGVHRDGYPFISLHMINRYNIGRTGTSVYDADENFLTRKVFSARLDSLYGEDHRIRHGVEDVEQADPRLGDGTRDMLLMSYDPR